MSEAPTVPNRSAITASLMLATLMNTLDSTIANVAVPHIQGSLSAASDEVVWVLTSYVIASAMVTPVAGWLSNRLGMKTVFLFSVIGFTAASMLCGLASNLPELVVFRLLQGGLGALSMPLGQTVLLNIYPPSQHAKAMAIWAMGAIVGPLLGPIIGGYITEAYSWRWCFFINLPLGVIATFGIWTFMPSERQAVIRRFDFLGFGSLIVTIAALQLVLDRGPGQDWFASGEIWAEAIVSATAFWIFITHTLTTRTPFIDLAILRDANFVTGCVFLMVVQGVIFGSLALLPQLTQGLLGYPVLLSGISNTPRGVGMMMSMMAVPKLVEWFDARLILLVGIFGTGLSLWQMSHFDLSMGLSILMFNSFWQGLAQGLMFVPLSALAYATLKPEYRAEAASLYNLLRFVGISISISGLQALAVYSSQASHAGLAAGAITSDPVFHWAVGAAFSPETTGGAQALNAEVTRQATMVAYVNDFRLMFLMSICCAPLLLLLRPKQGRSTAPQDVAVE